MVLMYHSVVDESISAFVDPNNSVTTTQFSAHLTFLAEKCNVISLDDLVAWFDGEGELPARPVLITFDDGYLDNLRNVAPMLEAYGMPATVFLCTGYVERGETQWIDRLYTMFQFRMKHSIRLPHHDRPYDVSRSRDLERCYREAAGLLLRARLHAREEVLGILVEQLKPTREAPRLTLTWEDVTTLQKEYPQISLGLHTRDHLELTELEPYEIQAELALCRSDFEKKLGRCPKYFSYPFGRHSGEIERAVESSGFLAAMATQPSSLVDSRTNRYAIPRFNVLGARLDLEMWQTGAFKYIGK